MGNDTPLVTRAYNLGLKAVPNFVALGEEVIRYYEQHLGELPTAIRNGFVLPEKKKKPIVEVVSLNGFKVTDTDLDQWLKKAEQFAKKHLGVAVNLRQQFVLPTELPWPSAIPIFDPGTLTNRNVFNLLKNLGYDPWEETSVMNYAGAQAFGQPTLHLIENSVRPNVDTMGLSPDDLRQTGRSYLRLRGYGLAFALRHFAKKDFFDKETWTWFPKDRLADGNVAFGDWGPSNRQVRFRLDTPGYRHPCGGARVAIPVPLAVF